jgi:hypothetical protein
MRPSDIRGLATRRNRALEFAWRDARALAEAAITLHEDELSAAQAARLGILDDEHRVDLTASELAALEFAEDFAESAAMLAGPGLGLGGVGRSMARWADRVVARHFAGHEGGYGCPAIPTAAGLIARARRTGYEPTPEEEEEYRAMRYGDADAPG